MIIIMFLATAHNRTNPISEKMSHLKTFLTARAKRLWLVGVTLGSYMGKLNY